MKMSYQAMGIFSELQRSKLEKYLNFFLQEVLQNLQINPMIYLPFKSLIVKEGDAE